MQSCSNAHNSDERTSHQQDPSLVNHHPSVPSPSRSRAHVLDRAENRTPCAESHAYTHDCSTPPNARDRQARSERGRRRELTTRVPRLKELVLTVPLVPLRVHPPAPDVEKRLFALTARGAVLRCQGARKSRRWTHGSTSIQRVTLCESEPRESTISERRTEGRRRPPSPRPPHARCSAEPHPHTYSGDYHSLETRTSTESTTRRAREGRSPPRR